VGGVIFIYLFFFFFLVGLGFELRALQLQSRRCLNHTSSPFCSGYFGGWSLQNFLPGLTLNLHPPDLSLPSS
jgi:hypothetical protein